MLLQLPVLRYLRPYRPAQALMFSLLCWSAGFAVLWLTGVSTVWGIGWAVVALLLIAIATASYTPIASTLVSTLAPESLRGVYLSLNSQCWAIGFLLGPALGGIAMDQPPEFATAYWLALAASIGLGLLILQLLDRQLQTQNLD